MKKVIAITVFCLLAVAYYAFFAPFVGGRIWEFILLGLYSPVVCPFLWSHTYPCWVVTCCVFSLSYRCLTWFILIPFWLQALVVFVLYVRCTAINPADPGIMSKFERGGGGGDMGHHHDLPSKDIARRFSEAGSHLQSSPSVASRTSTLPANSSVKGSVGDAAQRVEPLPRKSCYNPLAILCGVFVYEDCRKQEVINEHQGDSEEALFCTLCNAEVITLTFACFFTST